MMFVEENANFIPERKRIRLERWCRRSLKRQLDRGVWARLRSDHYVKYVGMI